MHLPVGLLLIAVAVQSADAIQCYECEEENSEKCRSDSKSWSTCAGDKCYREFPQNDPSKVTRGCIRGQTEHDGCVSGDKGGTEVTTCYCSTDRCNSEPRPPVPTWAPANAAATTAAAASVGRLAFGLTAAVAVVKMSARQQLLV